MTPQFHTQNRQAFAKHIGDDAIAIIDTAATITRRGDYEYPYRPDSNFYYLTGISEAQAVLILAPGQSNPKARELLFISGDSNHTSQWQGPRLAPEQASDMSGVASVLPLNDLPFYLSRLTSRFPNVSVNDDERARNLRQQFPTIALSSVLPALDQLRLIKQPVEIDLIRRAAAITEQAIQVAVAALKPNQSEFELEGILIGSMLSAGARLSFDPIVAADINSTYIHYPAKVGRTSRNGLILFDVGAEFGLYAADISRTVPVSGTFTKRQQAIYDIVKKAQIVGIKAHRPGTTIAEIDALMRASQIEDLKAFGLPTTLADYPHISHHLGLDVHDTGSAYTKLEPGMLVTCEPGLYLRDEGIGVRLEDDVLITTDGYELLSSGPEVV